MSVDARIAGNIWSLPGQIVSFTAGAAITKGQPVYVSGDMTVSPAINITQNTIGVAVINQPTVGKQVSVLMGCPIVYMTASTAFAAGLYVTPTTASKVLGVPPPTQAVNEAGTATYTLGVGFLVGIALEAASGADAIIRVAVIQQITPMTL
jgi:hypothetical protein